MCFVTYLNSGVVSLIFCLFSIEIAAMIEKDKKAFFSRVRQRIRKLRLENQLSQEELCERAEISIDAVNRIENGSRTPNLETLFKIACALDVQVAILVGNHKLPDTPYPISIMRIIRTVEQHPESIHQACEKLLKTALKEFCSPY
jgi:transcriptional regulator with XRE-family HTH domain